MIDTEALRKKVIDLAIQGKLTEQLPSDGDAETLYAQILDHKSQLIKEGKIKKDKALPDIAADEIPFETPQNWKWVRLGTIITLQSGQDLNATDYNSDNNGIPYITGASNYRDDGTLIINRWTDSPKAYAIKGDILLSCKGTVGKLTILDEEEVHIARQIMGIRTYLVSVKFIRYFVDCMLERIKSASKGLIPGIERNDILNLSCPLPPLAEQKRIVEKIEDILAQIDIVDDLQAKYSNDLAVLKSKIIDAGIQGKLTEQLPEDGDAEDLYARIQKEKDNILEFRGGRKDKSIKTDDEEKPFEIPNNWKWIRFGEVGLFKKGPFGSALTKSMFIPKSKEAIKVYEQQHAIKKDASLGTYYISREYFESNMSGFEVKSGDIIVSCAGTIGETYILPDEIEQGIINQALMRVTLVPSIDKEFFMFYFDSNLKTNAQNESNGMAIKNIPPFDVMKNWYFPLPPVAEQKRIVNRINDIMEYLF